MDNERPQNISVLKDFTGLVSDADPRGLPPGAFAEQVNVFSLQLGSIEPRGGLKEVALTYLE